MPVATLYGFITDDALKITTKVDLANNSDQGYGILDGEVAAYLVNRGVLGDTRRTRLSLLESRAPKGSISFLFDQNHADTEMLNKMTDQESGLLFNILERIYYRQEYTDSDLEAQLAGSTYMGYVPLSLNYAIEEGTATATNIDGVTKVVTFKDWFSFEFKYGNIHLIVHAWTKKSAFAANYPYTTITAVIPPYDPEKLVDPVELLQDVNLNILTNGSTYIFNQTDTEQSSRDQNGTYVYTTKFIIDSTRTIQLPFALVYCGPSAPTGLECRNAIKDYLEENTSVTESELETIFPDLFVNSRFYVVPLWDMYTSLTDRDVYNSIWSLKVIQDKIDKIWEQYDISFINEYVELMTNAQNKMLLMSLPDPLNAENLSILAQHPTYQDYSSQVPGFKYMSVETQEFASKLSRCLAVLNGDSTSTEFITIKDGAFIYMTFTAGRSEYYVMNKQSYLDYLENI